MHDDKSQSGAKAQPYWNSFRIAGTFAFCVVTLVAGWKILNATFVVDLSGFSFSDFLSLVLAFFSISLSLVFYMKASETSNTFYDNTYKFTSNVSEILGRIEAGFSERLRHMDEGYSRISDKLDRTPFHPGKTEEKIAKEQGFVDEKQKERDQLIDELLAKTQLQQSEKEAYISRLHEQETELSRAREEVAHLRRRMMRAAEHDEGEMIRKVIDRARLYAEASDDREALSQALQLAVRRHGSPRVLRQLKERHIIDDERNLTDYGYDLMLAAA